MTDADATQGSADRREIARLEAALAGCAARAARQRAETQHRVRNLLGVVRAITSRSLERAVSLEALAMHQSGRISAVARIEETLDASGGAGAGLDHLLWDEWLVVLSASEAWRAQAEGPDVLLTQKAAERIGLAFHELTTNALKFGALSSSEGCIRVDWRIEAGRLDLTWVESGVAAMNASPQHVGFGRDLLESGLGYDLHAETKLDFAPGGLKCFIRLPVRDNVVQRGAANLPGPGSEEP